MRNVRTDSGAESSWLDWPEELADQARELVEEVRAGRPAQAVELMDGMLGDLTARRRLLADMANRRFEPSTDDR